MAEEQMAVDRSGAPADATGRTLGGTPDAARGGTLGEALDRPLGGTEGEVPEEALSAPIGTPTGAPPPRPLDAIDRDILRLLQTDGRASVRSVAERVHVSRANAYARINRLIDDGVIRGFSARVNHERAGHGASAYITLKIVQNSWRTVREQLRALPGATHIALVSGDFDVLLLVHTPDNRTLRELVLTRLQSIPEVLSTRTLLVFEETDLNTDHRL